MPLQLISPEEQITRKKEDEKPSTPRIRKEYPRIPKIIMLGKALRAGVPVIPEDPCCAKICQTLNDNIEEAKGTLESVAYLRGEKAYKSIQKAVMSTMHRSLLYQIGALEEHRQDLKDNNSCECIAEPGTVKEKERKEIEIVTPLPRKLRITHVGEKSIIPPTNSCCPKSCKILNNTIDNAVKIFDNIELRGGPEALKNLRYEAWSSRAITLQDYRAELKDRGICKCFE